MADRMDFIDNLLFAVVSEHSDLRLEYASARDLSPRGVV
jgi:hypothetical protein